MISKNECIFTSSFPPEDNEIRRRCLSSWKKYTNNIILIQPPSEIEKVKFYFPDAEIIETSTVPKSFAWAKPYCPNIMDFIQLTEYSDVVIINSDIYLNHSPEEWHSEWKLENDKSFICGIKTNYDENSNLFAFEPYGLDVFKLPKNTFKYFKNLDCEYLIGHPGWDYWLFYKLLEFGFDHKCKFDTNILHKMHSLNWSEEDAEYAKTLYDPILFKKERNELSAQDHFLLLQDFIQYETNRKNWTIYNNFSKTWEYLRCANNLNCFRDTDLKTFFFESPKLSIFICLGSSFIFVIDNFSKILNAFNAKYFNARLAKSFNKTIDKILLECDFPFILFLNDSSVKFPKYFLIQNPLDILVSIYLDFIKNSLDQNLDIDSTLYMLLRPMDKDKYKNMTIDECIKDMAPLLNEHLLKIVKLKKNLNLEDFNIVYYEDIINNENKLFLVFEKILTQIYGENSDHNLENFLPLLKWPPNYLNKESSQPGYYKQVLREETINELNTIFQEFNDNFYFPKK